METTKLEKAFKDSISAMQDEIKDAGNEANQKLKDLQSLGEQLLADARNGTDITNELGALKVMAESIPKTAAMKTNTAASQQLMVLATVLGGVLSAI